MARRAGGRARVEVAGGDGRGRGECARGRGGVAPVGKARRGVGGCAGVVQAGAKGVAGRVCVGKAKSALARRRRPLVARWLDGARGRGLWAVRVVRAVLT